MNQETIIQNKIFLYLLKKPSNKKAETNQNMNQNNIINAIKLK